MALEHSSGTAGRAALIERIVGFSAGMSVAGAGIFVDHDTLTTVGLGISAAAIVTAATLIFISNARIETAVDDYNADARVRGCHV